MNRTRETRYELLPACSFYILGAFAAIMFLVWVMR